MSSEQETRRSFRVEELIYLTYEPVSELEFEQGLDHWKIARGNNVGVRSKLLHLDAKLEEKLYLLRSDSLPLAEYLHLLNEKISTIIDELPALKENRSTLAKQEPQTCEIGADGLLFSAENPLPVGSKLAVRLMFAADQHYIETFCRVVRVTDPYSDENPRFRCGIAVEFLGMKPEQQDALIQHLFDRESATLRMRRLELEADELKLLAE